MTAAHPLATRLHRAVLADMDDNHEARDFALDEINDCPCCLRRALKYTVQLLAAEMTHDEWNRASATIWLEKTIRDSLDHYAEKEAG